MKSPVGQPHPFRPGACLALAFVSIVIVTATLRAQDPAQAPAALAVEPAPAFEVASVKKSGPAPTGGFRFGMQPGGRFTVSQMPLSSLITLAYGIQRFQVIGGLVSMLSAQLDRPVYDRTNLTGSYDIDLEYTPDRMPQIPAGATLPPGLTLPSPDGPSLMTALQEQLGLKLESMRAPVELLVIDSVEQPTPD